MDLHATCLRLRLRYKDWRNGLPYHEIKYIQTHSIDDGLSIRTIALRNLLDYARINTRFYRDYNGYNLSDYPIMTKADLISNYTNLRIDPAAIPGQEGPLYIQRTSGSTGNPLAMPQDTKKRQRRAAELNYFASLLNYRCGDKMIHLRTWDNFSRPPVDFKKKYNIVPFDIKKLDEQNLHMLCDLIVKEKAVYVRGYASSFERIAKVASNFGYSFPSLKLIVATSEALEDNVRTLVKEVMGCEVVSQYSNEECGLLAQERIPTKEGNNPMYFNWSGYIFEFLKINEDIPANYGELARIVVTDLHNYAFPVIRYDTGDTCIVKAPDKYSKGYPVLDKLYGRKFDLTYSSNGTPIYPLSYGRILKNYDIIDTWQFIQVGQNDYILKLVLKWNDDEIIQKMVQNIKEEIIGNEANVKVDVVDKIPVMNSGKRKPVKNEWKNNG